ncbi:alpha/beta hydrolase [Pararhizobium sp. O133]|uniref:alpha/beta hydrolase n=1 Tax=Pararhizobium sp. O133 TaxID=3449278 RepID=UPI003F686191
MHLSTAHLIFRTLPVLILAAILSGPVAAAPLKPFKDELFSYGTVLETGDNGDYLVIDYDKMRDLHGRDEIPERKVTRPYVSLGVKNEQSFETVEAGGRSVDVVRVGRERGAAFTVIFIHGRGGDRRLGANDWIFGGNFNRLKNLAVGNGGVYYSASVRSFDDAGVADIAALIGYAQAQSPGRPIVLSCASMGSIVCWGIARDPAASAALKGMMIMGGPSDPQFKDSAAYKRKLPVFFSHGGADNVYAAIGQVKFYRGLKAAGYPTRLVVFQTGTHGTPIRMTDWRDALNWIGVK